MRKVLFAFVVFLISTIVVGQNKAITNQDVIDMLDMGFSKEVIIAKIKNSATNFNTDIQILKDLKDAGVATEIIVSMVECNGNSIITEKRNGIYYIAGNDSLQKIIPSVFSGNSANTLATAFTYGIASTAMKSSINNAESTNIIQSNKPSFVFFFEDSNEDYILSDAANPNMFVLVELDSKSNKRELKTGSINLFSGNNIGVDEEKTIPFSIEVINNNTYRITPKIDLVSGEYCFFYQGTIPVGGLSNKPIYDFSIQGDDYKVKKKKKRLKWDDVY